MTPSAALADLRAKGRPLGQMSVLSPIGEIMCRSGGKYGTDNCKAREGL